MKESILLFMVMVLVTGFGFQMLQLPVQLLGGNYLKGVNALATIASVGVTVIAIHQGSNLLRASIHKL